MTPIEARNMLAQNGRIDDVYILARYFYSIGEEFISDEVYSSVEDYLRRNTESEYTKVLFDQSYDDDEMPEQLLDELGLQSYKYSSGGNKKYYDELNGSKSMSIRSVINYKEAYEYFMSKKGAGDLIMSGKRNGLNLKTLFKYNSESDKTDLALILTRGRSGNSIDVTKIVSRHIPLNLKTKNDVTIYGEAIINESALDYIVRDNGQKFTSARMAANSMIRVESNPEYYKWFHYNVFNADGVANTISETLDILKEEGFETVPYYIIKEDEIPDTFDDFKPWLKEKMEIVFKEMEEDDLDFDGIVVDVNNKNYRATTSNQYLDRNIALKFDLFSYYYYVGEIVGIEVEQQRVKDSFVILIKPLKARDGSTNRRIVSYNPDFIINNNFKVGSKIYFERNSGAITVPIVGERLKKIMNDLSTNETVEKINSF